MKTLVLAKLFQCFRNENCYTEMDYNNDDYIYYILHKCESVWPLDSSGTWVFYVIYYDKKPLRK